MIKRIGRLGFDVVDGCQLKCIGCPNSILTRKISFISLENFRKCCENFDVDYISHIRLFNYGEPLLHPQLVDLTVEISKQKWYRRNTLIEISTNAQYKDFTKITELLKTGLVGLVAVSCDGADGSPASYESMRPPAKWETLINFLTNVKEIRDNYAPKTKLMTRTISGPEGKIKWNEILISRGWTPEFRGYLYLPGVPQKKPHPPVKNGLCHFIPDAFSGHSFNVNSQGLVVPCCAHPCAEVLGDLKKEKYNEILIGEGYQKFAELLKTNRLSHPFCGDCWGYRR